MAIADIVTDRKRRPYHPVITDLRLGHNGLRSFPTCIWALTSLQSLELQHNRLAFQEEHAEMKDMEVGQACPSAAFHTPASKLASTTAHTTR